VTVVHHTGFPWIAVAGFVLFALGSVNPFVWRATSFAKAGPLKPVISNTLLGLGAALILVGLLLR